MHKGGTDDSAPSAMPVRCRHGKAGSRNRLEEATRQIASLGNSYNPWPYPPAHKSPVDAATVALWFRAE